MIKIEFASTYQGDAWVEMRASQWAEYQSRPSVPDRWSYLGDVDLSHGGVFIDISTWKWGYAEAVRVTDLDSACGFEGAMLIERVTINGLDDSERIRSAVAGCGSLDWYVRGGQCADPAVLKNVLRLMIAEALLQYGHFDLDDGSYGPDDVPASETIQTDANFETPMEFDGWLATKRLMPWEDIFTYVVNNHLQD
jgi:hypothetical protein